MADDSPSRPPGSVRSALSRVTYGLGYIWSHPANRGQRLRVAARTAAFHARGARGRASIVPLGERSRFEAHPRHFSAAAVVYGNPPDWREMQVWRRIIGPGDLFVDVGANVGVYSILLAEMGAAVTAVEPGPDAAAQLRRNAALNGYAIDVVEAVLSDEEGEVTFTASLDASNHIVAGPAAGAPGAAAATEPVATVRAITLDALLGDRTAAGVKIDVEGAELLVLSGAPAALKEGRIRLLQLEWNDYSQRFFGVDRREIAELLTGYGYSLARPDDHGGLVADPRPAHGTDVFARLDG